MANLITAIGTALWLGILTSISPCPMATNIAAISYINKNLLNRHSTLLSGLFFTFGRMVAYSFLGILIVNGLLHTPAIARSLQAHLNTLLGPAMILVGLIILKLIPAFTTSLIPTNKWLSKLSQSKQLGSFILGFIFALSFCPISAALFFGSLIPLSISYKSGFFLPTFYGIGTALPVLICAYAIAWGTYSVSRIFKFMTKIEVWGRRLTGIIFISIGIYYCSRYLF